MVLCFHLHRKQRQERNWCQAINSQSLPPSDTPSSKTQPPTGSITAPNNATNRGSSVPIHERVGTFLIQITTLCKTDGKKREMYEHGWAAQEVEETVPKVQSNHWPLMEKET